MLHDKYEGDPALASYLTARMANYHLKTQDVKQNLNDALMILRKVGHRKTRAAIESYIERIFGMLEARSSSRDRWNNAKLRFEESHKMLPTNANALYWIAVCLLELGRPE